jgi:putative two-component system response regulator
MLNSIFATITHSLTQKTMSPNSFDADAGAQMERMVLDLGRMYRERNQALLDVAQAHHEALFRLALAAEVRDNDTGAHIVRMGFLAEALALAVGEPVEWAVMLRKAAPMHDVGKIGIPDAVLKKPGSFTSDERAVMNQHPKIGAEILGKSGIPLFQLAAEVALSHHERWDGQGYPAGLAGKEIPLCGRIVAVVDCWDALTMDRCYRPAFGDPEALEMLRAQRGGAYDPALIDAFESVLPQMVAIRDAVNRLDPSFADLVDGVPGLLDDDPSPTVDACAPPASWARASAPARIPNLSAPRRFLETTA